MVLLQYCLIKDNEISEILYSLCHRQTTPVIAVCSGQRMKNFYQLININSGYTEKSIQLTTFEEYIANKAAINGATVLLMCAPNNFQEMQYVLQNSQNNNQRVVLMILEVNKKYINILKKKVNGLTVEQLEYSPNKFVGINDKIRDFVDKNYDMNRAAFYAYGEYINVYRFNPLKKIFRSELINLDQFARSFGFTAAQRVKEGNFLKSAAQREIAANKKAQKRQRRKQLKNQASVPQQQQEPETLQAESSSDKKMKKKTKKIAKSDASKQKIKPNKVKKANKIIQ